MKNQNIHIMKQPELGKKVAELRKSSGLTQEELVEKCNISVRTIQRIEAGEVVPRSYTLKTILNALGANFDSVFKDDDNTGFINKFFSDTYHNKTVKNYLILACLFGVIYFIVGFFEAGFEFAKFFGESFGRSTFWYIVVKSISIVSFVVFMSGFLILGNIYKSYLLKISTVLIIAFMVIVGFYDMFTIGSFSDFTDFEQFAGVSKAITSGILQILFGIALLKLKSNLGSLVSVTAVFEIVTGLFFLSVVGVLIGLTLLIPTEILEILVLYKAAEKLKNSR